MPDPSGSPSEGGGCCLVSWPKGTCLHGTWQGCVCVCVCVGGGGGVFLQREGFLGACSKRCLAGIPTILLEAPPLSIAQCPSTDFNIEPKKVVHFPQRVSKTVFYKLWFWGSISIRTGDSCHPGLLSSVQLKMHLMLCHCVLPSGQCCWTRVRPRANGQFQLQGFR